jgi:hypothetical protein
MDSLYSDGPLDPLFILKNRKLGKMKLEGIYDLTIFFVIFIAL